MTTAIGVRLPGSERRLVLEFPADFPWERRLAPIWERDDMGRPIVEHDAAYRRHITERDPLLFAILYLREHITAERIDREAGERYDLASFSEWHLDYVTDARRALLGEAAWRMAYVVSRDGAKSTWIGAPITPLWVAAHHHKRFVMLFGNNSDQAELHLRTIRTGLATNTRLLDDFPHLAPSREVGSSDSGRMVTRSGTTFAARGMESSVQGGKSGADRPDLIILDDILPDAGATKAAVEKRLLKVRQGILPMNDLATVLWAGTTVLYDDPVHQLAMHALGERTAPWITETHFQARYYPAILDEGTPSERSLWPAKWSLSWLLNEAYPSGDRTKMSRDFAMNKQNRPELVAGDRFTRGLFVIEPRFEAAQYVLTCDTAVTTKDTSDPSAICLASIDQAGRQACVELVWADRVSGTELREMLWALKARNPRLGRAYVEVNQGGELWRETLSPLPPGLTLAMSRPDKRGSKKSRIEWLLDQHNRGAVVYREEFPMMFDQAIAWPRVKNDDMIDVVEAAVACLFGLPMGET